MRITGLLLPRDSGSSSTSSTDSSSGGGNKNLGLILGVSLSAVVVLCVGVIIVWRIMVRQRSSSTVSSPSAPQLPSEKLNSNTLRGFKFPQKSGPPPPPRIDPYVLPQMPNAVMSSESFGNTASSEYHYKTWRAGTASRSIDDHSMYADRNSARMQARDGLHSTGEMKDLINMLNSQRVEGAVSPPAYQTLQLPVKPMRPISVDSLGASTIAVPHTVTKDFGAMHYSLKRNHSVDRTVSDGYTSDATVPSVMRRPKFNPREGAPMIPSIYFEPVGFEDAFLSRSNSMDSRRSTLVPNRNPSQLGRTSSSRQNHPPLPTRKRQNSEPGTLRAPSMTRLSTIADDSHSATRADSTYPRVSAVTSISEYPESRATSIYVDPEVPLSRAPISPTQAPSRTNSARSGWI